MRSTTRSTDRFDGFPLTDFGAGGGWPSAGGSEVVDGLEAGDTAQPGAEAALRRIETVPALPGGDEDLLDEVFGLVHRRAVD